MTSVLSFLRGPFALLLVGLLTLFISVVMFLFALTVAPANATPGVLLLFLLALLCSSAVTIVLGLQLRAHLSIRPIPTPKTSVSPRPS